MAGLFTLLPEAVATIRADNKPAILGLLADRFAQVYGLDRADVLARIGERERLGSTGFGRGVAIPHARVGGVTRPIAAFLRLEAPAAFDAIDGQPIDVVFGLLSPEHAGAAHLHALAAISRLMRDEAMHAALVAAPDAEAIYGLLCNVLDRDAA
jgi:PTS system nitrogen regulatory IIA component